MVKMQQAPAKQKIEDDDVLYWSPMPRIYEYYARVFLNLYDIVAENNK